MKSGRWVGLWCGVVVTGALLGSALQGCSSDHGVTVYPDPEAGPPKEGGSGDGGGSATCPTDVPIDAKTLGWKPPNPPQAGKCQDADIAAFKAYLSANPDATNEDFENFVKNRGATCHDCIFGNADDTTWPPAPVKDGKVVTFNVGACYAIVTGDQNCGRAIQNAWDCGFDACLLCSSPSALTECRTKARTGACLTYEDKVKTACGATTTADEVCGLPFDSIRVQCQTTGTPVADAGTD